MNKDSIKNSIRSFAHNFFFNISFILIFGLFININKENIILAVGIIVNIIIYKILGFSSNNEFIQKYFCTPTTESQINAIGSIQLFGFITGHYTVNKYLKDMTMSWIGTLLFLLFSSILFGRIYIEDSFGFASLMSYWLLGFILGSIFGYLSGIESNKSKKQELKDYLKENSNLIKDESDKSCSKENDQDYVCQAFKDGKVFESL
jgi:hypothetical protein